jgi:predicted transcriptional regulator
VNLEVQGPFHHYSVPVAALSSTGEFRIWISHAIVEIRNGTETRRLDLSAHVERHFDVPGVGPLHARYNATMFEGRFRGQLDLSLAGLGHLLAPSLELHDVTHLGAPLSNATVHGTPPEFVTRRESRLDVFGRFDLALLDANHHEGGDASSDQRLWGRLDGRIDNLLIDRHARVVMGGALPTMVAGTFFVALAVAVFVVLRRTMASVLAWSAGASWPSVIVASSKIAPQHVLDHPTRRHLLTLLETRYAMTRVGTFVVEAAQTLGMGRFNVQYHLRMMHRAKVIELVRMPGNTSLYVAPNHGFMSDERTRMLAALLNHEIGRAVAEALATSPGASQAAIIRDALARLGPRAPTRMAVHKWVRRFDQQNLVRREQRGHRVLYHPSPFLHEFVHALKSAGNVAKAIPTLGRRAET